MLLQQIKVLSLDATNTLIRLKQPPGETYANFARDFGFNQVDKNAISPLFLKAFKQLEKEKPCYGFYGAGSKSWWTDLMRSCYGDEIASSSKFPALADRVFDFYKTKEAWCLTDEKNLEFLRSLSAHNLKIAVVSNFDERLHDLLNLFGISEFVSEVLLSAEVGFQKPESEMFQLLLNRFKITDPKLCLHIGDNYEKDYLPAKALGMHAKILGGNIPNVPSFDCIKSISGLNKI
ncbi:hypothetical protein M3Y97_00084300 [Aphelenchoides bicaudatus]|nr:hypothetical protein M3Y97_00084300 [Aphelenchoides bicaudatus]